MHITCIFRCIHFEDIGKNADISIIARCIHFEDIERNVEIGRCIRFRDVENEYTNRNSLNRNSIYILSITLLY